MQEELEIANAQRISESEEVEVQDASEYMHSYVGHMTHCSCHMIFT